MTEDYYIVKRSPMESSIDGRIVKRVYIPKECREMFDEIDQY